ncbi:PTS sugar transporter subunit IIB [Streptomonospora litoralis]|uniref:Ascorbate-specific phosphotransferase enzyme IIB component n=1 Tax=Streptomonospora litoralis TaxID=2498135 RepID=A0A4P6PYK7_9ACTN|nr:PTS sugar transporter subunit IIB [Streptomonospora litoralis]QBI53213.1 Ascorbate-specific phosphotransferase enzyme IIB component [Streptomonospora litoralis]
MKILAVCGMGIGTSVLLKSNAEKAANDLGLDADVEIADIGTARGAAATADVVLTSGELAAELGDVGIPVVVVDNFVDGGEIREKLGAAVGR